MLTSGGGFPQLILMPPSWTSLQMVKKQKRAAAATWKLPPRPFSATDAGLVDAGHNRGVACQRCTSIASLVFYCAAASVAAHARVTTAPCEP